MLRWGWRLFRREWRQQLLILGLLTVAVAATIWGAGVATNTLPYNPNYATFGTAAALVTLPGSDPHLAADIATIQASWGPADVIENQNVTTGATASVHLRAENPHGLQRPDARPGQRRIPVRSRPGRADQPGRDPVRRARGRHLAGRRPTWRVTGIVQNPSNLQDEFALVAPGQVTHPSQVIMLLGSAAASQIINANGAPDQSALAGIPAATPSIPTGSASTIPPATIVLVVAVLGLIFIGLVAVAGFSVMAQRRLRALGMLSAIGATERNVRLVMIVNGMVVGVAAALAGAVLGFAAWFAYAPTLSRTPVTSSTRPTCRGGRSPPGSCSRSRPQCSPPAARPRPWPACRSWPRCPAGPPRRGRSTVPPRPA